MRRAARLHMLVCRMMFDECVFLRVDPLVCAQVCVSAGVWRRLGFTSPPAVSRLFFSVSQSL